MYSQHLQLKPIEGVSGQEPTAFTKKTIKELMAEELSASKSGTTKTIPGEELAKAMEDIYLAPVKPKRVAAPALQEPPHLRKPAAKPSVAHFEALAEPEVDMVAEKPKSFLSRFIKS